jgi:glycine dehydrogenase subunit 1
MPFIPHTADDIKKMLATIGIDHIEQLFDEIPQSLTPGKFAQVPAGLNEQVVTRLLIERQPPSKPGNCFIGAGAYEHHIPAAIWEITTRGEFYTAYTPYQAEASQGSLQLIYEYQTMMAELMGMEVSNASLYDGASALAEAALMAVRIARNDAKRILLPESIHPIYRKVLTAIIGQQNIEIETLPFDPTLGIVDPTTLNKVNAKGLAAIIIPQPNFFGCLEDVDALTNWAHAHEILAIACVNPTAMALLKPPGQWGEKGADIACGEGQPLGVPLASGGPYFGFMCCKKTLVRQLPGRIVGRTVDGEGREGFTLTLQAREQHIRRSKATSNICTNQGLVVVAATIYMSLLGPQGLREVAVASHQRARELMQKLIQIKGISPVFSRPIFHEFVIRINAPVENVLMQMADMGIQAGFNLKNDYPKLGDCLLVCVTETKSEVDLLRYQEMICKVL